MPSVVLGGRRAYDFIDTSVSRIRLHDLESVFGLLLDWWERFWITGANNEERPRSISVRIGVKVVDGFVRE